MLVFGIVLTLIPLIVDAIDGRFYYNRKTFFSALFLIGEIGIVYSLVQYWLTIPQNGFWEYLKYLFTGLLFFIPYWNFGSESPNILQGKTVYDYIINLPLCGFFLIGFFMALSKAMSNVSLYGIREYFGMCVLFGLFAAVIMGYLILVNSNSYDRPSLIFSAVLFVLSVTMIGFTCYYLNKAISLIPSWVYTAIGFGLLGIGYLILCSIGSSHEN